MKRLQLGKGRAVWLNYKAWALTSDQEFSYRGLAEYDYRMLWVGRAVLWAASREGDVSVTSVLGENAAINRSEPVRLPPISLDQQGRQPYPGQGRPGAAPRLRRMEEGPWRRRRDARRPASRPAVPLNLPRLRAGDYFLDAVVRSARGVEACGRRVVRGHQRLRRRSGRDRPALRRARRDHHRQRPLRGTRRRTASSALQFRDSYDRVLAQQTCRP